VQISPTARVCPNCGAPVSVPEHAREVTCAYCKAVLIVDQSVRQAQAAAQKITKLILLFVGGIMALTLISIVGGIAMSCWMQQKIVGSVNETQRRALRQSCRAQCPGQCQARGLKGKDVGPCIDACEARCAQD
jgi:LSD1 subclass zinc finger protein